MGDRLADANQSEDWITFEQAGRLIDGAEGWWEDPEDGQRPRAMALLSFARDRQIRIQTKSWGVFRNATDSNPPNPDDMKEFIQILVAREKSKKNKTEYSLPNGAKYTNVFSVFDEKNGHFDVVRIEISKNQNENRVMRHLVARLRFHGGDIADLFELSSGWVSAADDGSQTKARTGRPMATWWPDFAEELAVYLHDCGVPEGEDSAGQSAFINAICNRLAQRGKAEPSRSAVQPVVNRVLKRIRSAKN